MRGLFRVVLTFAFATVSLAGNCTFSNLFVGATLDCKAEFNAGQASSLTCYRDADCLGVTCKITQSGGFFFHGRVNTCDQTINVQLNSISGSISTSGPINGFSVAVPGFPETYLELSETGHDGGYAQFTIHLVTFGISIPVSPQIILGTPGCFWLEAFCYRIYIYVVSGIIVFVPLLVVCICCMRKRPKRNIVIPMSDTFHEPLLGNAKEN